MILEMFEYWKRSEEKKTGVPTDWEVDSEMVETAGMPMDWELCSKFGSLMMIVVGNLVWPHAFAIESARSWAEAFDP